MHIDAAFARSVQRDLSDHVERYSPSGFAEHFFELWLWANDKWPHAPAQAQFEAELSMDELDWGKSEGFPGDSKPPLVPLRAVQELVRKFLNTVSEGRTTSGRRGSQRVALSVTATSVYQDGYAHLRAENLIREAFRGSSKATVDELVRIWGLVQAELGSTEGSIFNPRNGLVAIDDLARDQSSQASPSRETQV